MNIMREEDTYIVGIDPGTHKTGISIWKNDLLLIARVVQVKRGSIQSRIQTIINDIGGIINRYVLSSNEKHAFIEEFILQDGKNCGVMITPYIIGAFIYMLSEKKFQIHPLVPNSTWRRVFMSIVPNAESINDVVKTIYPSYTNIYIDGKEAIGIGYYGIHNLKKF